MQVSIVDNCRARVADVLRTVLEGANDVRFAVAFVTMAGLELVWDAVESVLDSSGRAEFLIALDGRVTEPEAARTLWQHDRRRENFDLYCYAPGGGSGDYHPKMYLAAGERVACLVGSSNLTLGGLRRNVEANVLIVGSATDEAISQAYETFTQLKFAPERFVPNAKVIELYEEFWQSSQRERAPGQAQAEQSLRAAIAACRKPTPALRDLTGWLALVYEVLPDGEFTNADVYAYEDYFRSRYPDNENVRAKVRQQLQVLRDMGLLEHIAPGHWRKRPVDPTALAD